MTSDKHNSQGEALAAYVDHVCDAFERRLRAADSLSDAAPRIEQVIADSVAALRSNLARELLLAEISLRAEQDRLVGCDDYLRRFPELKTLIEVAWDEAQSRTARNCPCPADSESAVSDASAVVVPNSSPAAAQQAGSELRAGTSAADEETVGLEVASTESSSTWVGRQVGVYRIETEIARGGMGVVYKAVDQRLNRQVALKMILGGQFASPEAVRRFHWEAQSAASLDHSGIVPIHEVNSHEDLHYYVMGYVEGTSLADRLREGPLPAQAAAELMLSVAEAVAYAHEQGIVHRDLKPANILLDANGQPRITDFGLAKRSDGGSDLTVDGQVLGTPGYMAPEQAAGRSAESSPATDVYSLGAVLYEILCGRTPFNAATYAEAIQQIQEEPPVPVRTIRRDVPRDLETICLKCLSKQPIQRYPTARELADDLRRFLAQERIAAKPIGWLERVELWARQRPALAATWGAMACFYAYHLGRLLLAKDVLFGSREHQLVTLTVAAWSAGAWWFQRQLDRGRWGDGVLYAWATMDVVILTLFLLCFNGPRSAYVMGYLVLTAGAALRFRTRLVWLVTGLSVAGYSMVLAEAAWRRPDLLPYHHTSISMFVVGLLTIGLMQGLLLRRVRRHYVEKR